MLLREYITDRVRRRQLAKAIPANSGYLWQLANHWKGRMPSPLMAEAIERHTGGIVSQTEITPPPSSDRKVA